MSTRNQDHDGRTGERRRFSWVRTARPAASDFDSYAHYVAANGYSAAAC
jgi:hypothetical protein